MSKLIDLDGLMGFASSMYAKLKSLVTNEETRALNAETDLQNQINDKSDKLYYNTSSQSYSNPSRVEAEGMIFFNFNGSIKFEDEDMFVIQLTTNVGTLVGALMCYDVAGIVSLIPERDYFESMILHPDVNYNEDLEPINSPNVFSAIVRGATEEFTLNRIELVTLTEEIMSNLENLTDQNLMVEYLNSLFSVSTEINTSFFEMYKFTTDEEKNKWNSAVNDIGVIASDDKIISVMCSPFGKSTFAKTASGKFYATGSNEKAQLGYHRGDFDSNAATLDNSLLAFKILSYAGTEIDPELGYIPTYPVENIKEIFIGPECLFVLKHDGTLWAIGANEEGQLGIGSKVNTKFFTQVNITDVKTISCGLLHTCLVKNDGTLWVCGNNSSGQLGLGNTASVTSFTKVNISGVLDADAGNSHTLVLKNDGTVWSCGSVGYGQTGISSPDNIKVLTQVNVTGVKEIYCGANHSIIVKNDGTVWSCGDNQYGQLGIGSTNPLYSSLQQISIDNIKHISVGANHNIIVKNDGTVWGCGDNELYQLGNSGGGFKNSFVHITNTPSNVIMSTTGIKYTMILDENGTPYTCGHNDKGQAGTRESGSYQYYYYLNSKPASLENLDKNIKYTTTEITKKFNEVGRLGNLKTSTKTNLVDAINEVFQNVDNGKQLIASAIDDSTITKDSTFEAMSNKINDMKSNNFTEEQKSSVMQSINDIVDMFDYKIIE